MLLFLKELLHMYVILLESDSVVNWLSRKDLCCTSVTVSGITRLVKLFSAKALSPINVTLDGIVIDSNALRPSRPASILVKLG